MNPGGEPERDDTGLPPVDIEIPDDARELDRDVQAYYREQRAVRRQQRRSRFRGFLAKDGIVLPLLACCLILALITGTLLTVFTAASDQGFPALSGVGGRTGAAAKATAGAPIVLPDAEVQVGGKQIRLRDLSRAMLVLVPPACACTTAVAQLAKFAATARATAYLVSSASQRQAASRLAGQVSRQPGTSITLAVDSANALGQYENGLTAVLVGPDHAATVTGKLQAGENLDQLRPALTR
ncbi:MAG TPA: hypothetical protein VGI66_16590 [Streptosporangiaceae bacterium]